MHSTCQWNAVIWVRWNQRFFLMINYEITNYSSVLEIVDKNISNAVESAVLLSLAAPLKEHLYSDEVCSIITVSRVHKA